MFGRPPRDREQSARRRAVQPSSTRDIHRRIVVVQALRLRAISPDSGHEYSRKRAPMRNRPMVARRRSESCRKRSVITVDSAVSQASQRSAKREKRVRDLAIRNCPIPSSDCHRSLSWQDVPAAPRTCEPLRARSAAARWVAEPAALLSTSVSRKRSAPRAMHVARQAFILMNVDSERAVHVP